MPSDTRIKNMFFVKIGPFRRVDNALPCHCTANDRHAIHTHPTKMREKSKQSKRQRKTNREN